MIRRIPGFIVGICTISIALVGCGSHGASSSTATITSRPSASPTPARSAALDKVVAQGNAEVPRIMAMFGHLYSSMAFSAKYPNTLMITYTFTKAVNAVTAKPRIATQGPVLDAACKTDFFPQMKHAGIPNPAAMFIWLNPDGSQVASYSCTSASTAM